MSVTQVKFQTNTPRSVLQRSTDSALHDSLSTQGNGRRSTAPQCILSKPEPNATAGTVARPGIAPPLTTARTTAQIEQIQPSARDAHGSGSLQLAALQTTHPCTTKVDSHANHASKAAIQPSIVCRRVVEPRPRSTIGGCSFCSLATAAACMIVCSACFTQINSHVMMFLAGVPPAPSPCAAAGCTIAAQDL